MPDEIASHNSNESEFTGGRFMDNVATFVSSLKLVATNGKEEDENEKDLMQRFRAERIVLDSIIIVLAGTESFDSDGNSK